MINRARTTIERMKHAVTVKHRQRTISVILIAGIIALLSLTVWLMAQVIGWGRL